MNAHHPMRNLYLQLWNENGGPRAISPKIWAYSHRLPSEYLVAIYSIQSDRMFPHNNPSLRVQFYIKTYRISFLRNILYKHNPR